MDESTQREWKPRSAVSEVFAGLVSGALCVTLAISMAALVFSGDLASGLPAGIGMALLGTIAVGLAGAIGASFPSTVSAPQSSSSAVVAAVAAAVAAAVSGAVASGGVERRLATVAVAVSLASLAVGLSLYALGKFRLGSLVRYIPYPVVGGFLTGTGWLIAKGALSVMSGHALTVANLAGYFSPGVAVRWVPGFVLAVVLVLLQRRVKHYLLVPVVLSTSLVLYYLALKLTGVSLARASSLGLLLGPFPSGSLFRPLTPEVLRAADWPVLGHQLVSIATVVPVTAISLLLNATGLELATRTDVDLDRELRVAGRGNLLSALGGGFPAFQALGFSVLSHKAGARTRWVGVVCAGVCGLTLFCGASLLGALPKVVLGGLLLNLGLGFLVEWVFDAYRRLRRLDYALILAIALVIALRGLIEGVGLGILVAATLFVVSYSRTECVKHALFLSSHGSNVERAESQQRLLHELGDSVFTLRLQGFLFFGSASALLGRVREQLRAARAQPLRFVVIDFEHVSGVDSSAVMTFVKMRQVAEAAGLGLVFAGLATEVRRAMELEGCLEGEAIPCFPDLDRGVEHCEERLLAREASRLSHLPAFGELMGRLFEGDAARVDRFVAYLERLPVAAGDTLFREGERADGLYLIESGRLSSLVRRADGSTLRLRTMCGGTLVGEMGVYGNAPRSATISAEQDCVLHRLSRESLERLHADDPDLALVFHRFAVRLLSERLAEKTREVQALFR